MYTKQEGNCREKGAMHNLCATNGRTEQCCGEHKERLELFCKDDETFICVLCVPRHSSHSLVFLHEAIGVYKDKIKTTLTSLESKVKEFKYMQNHHEKEIGDIKKDVFNLEKYIKHEFADLHQFLLDKEQQLIQQLKNDEANTLKQMEGNLECIKQEIVTYLVTDSDGNLEDKIKEEDSLKIMEENVKSIESDALAIKGISHSNVEIRQPEPVGLLTKDVFNLEKYIKQEFAELHQFLLDKEQQLIQLLKNEEANTLKWMEGSLECIKQEIVTYLVTDSDGNLEDKIKEEDSLKIMEEDVKSIESDALAIKGISHSNVEIRQPEPVGLLTVPETFEDVIVTFSEEEWEMLRKQDKELYRDVMEQNYETCVSDKIKPTLTSLESKVKEFKYMQNHHEKEIGDIKEDVFNLKKYIKQEFAELHQFLLDKEQQLIQQLKNDEANTLKWMEGNLECIKQEIVTYLVTDSDGNLEDKIKEEDSLKIMEENVNSVENDAVAIVGISRSNMEITQQEPVGLLTVPETFEDVTVTFTEEEWKLLKKQDKELYRDVMVQNYETCVSVGYLCMQSSRPGIRSGVGAMVLYKSSITLNQCCPFNGSNDHDPVPETFEDVTVTFSEEEWEMLRKQDKELYRDVMVQNYETCVSVDLDIDLSKINRIPGKLKSKIQKQISLKELVDKIKESKNNKAPGIDGIIIELYKIFPSSAI
ncbi:uncharacterized protein LOC122797710 [Protopterus annectens]|uniref:uncharacterized protein LOC122797710 n=1 Tax=Protopterus annectens TaxID=7888 RepID=UPI001CF940CD|nr:uncharacterized protein LOC122797710 [Protopterus annectens]